MKLYATGFVRGYITAAAIAVGAVAWSLTMHADPPPHGWSTPCKVVNVVDGDTVDVEVRRVIRIRLLDCWADETRTRNADQKQRGLAAKEHLRAVADGRDATLFVPGGDVLKDRLTLDRVLGRVWVGGEDLSELQVKGGFASKGK